MSKIFKCCTLSISIFLTACTNTPIDKNKDTVSSLGDVFAQSGRMADAEVYYAKAHALAPEQPSLLFKLADTQVQQGKLDEAANSYKQIMKYQPANQKARFRFARVSMLKGDLLTAYDQYRELLAKDQQNYHALNGLGVLLDNLHKSNLAQTCYQRALKYSKDDYSILNNLGLSYALSGNLEKARRYLSLSTQYSTTSRPKNNIDLINSTYQKIRNPSVRQQKLSTLLLVKSLKTDPLLAVQAVSLAQSKC